MIPKFPCSNQISPRRSIRNEEPPWLYLTVARGKIQLKVLQRLSVCSKTYYYWWCDRWLPKSGGHPFTITLLGKNWWKKEGAPGNEAVWVEGSKTHQQSQEIFVIKQSGKIHINEEEAYWKEDLQRFYYSKYLQLQSTVIREMTRVYSTRS